MEENRDPSLRGRAARLLSRLRRENLPDTLRGLKGAWLAASCVCALLVVAALICAHSGASGWAAALGGGAVLYSVLMDRLKISSLTVSDSDNLEGYAKLYGLM